MLFEVKDVTSKFEAAKADSQRPCGLANRVGVRTEAPKADSERPHGLAFRVGVRTSPQVVPPLTHLFMKQDSGFRI